MKGTKQQEEWPWKQNAPLWGLKGISFPVTFASEMVKIRQKSFAKLALKSKKSRKFHTKLRYNCYVLSFSV